MRCLSIPLIYICNFCLLSLSLFRRDREFVLARERDGIRHVSLFQTATFFKSIEKKGKKDRGGTGAHLADIFDAEFIAWNLGQSEQQWE